MPIILGGVLAVVILTACGATCRSRLDVRHAASEWAEDLAELPEIDPELARDCFATTMLAPPKPVEGHSHAEAAAIRTSATNFANSMATRMGAELYSVQMSRHDQRRGTRGSRKWFWSKDTNIPTRDDAPGATDVEYLCDVDYYVDMPEFLSRRAKPTLLYTVVPQVASGPACNDASFCFNEEGELEMIVSGAGSYRHHLWDYATDSLMVVSWGWVFPTITTYAVERRQVALHRQLVLLTPVKVFSGVAGLLAHFLLQGKDLERFNPIVRNKDQEAFVRFRVHAASKTQYTTARPSSVLCATVDADVDEAIATVARLNVGKLQLPTVKSWLKVGDDKAAAVLTEYHRLFGKVKVPTVFPVDVAVRTYQYEPQHYDQNAKSKMEAFMSPLVHGAFAPANDAASERRCVTGRINDLKKVEPKPSAFVDKCIEEFATACMRGSVLHPNEVEEIELRQTRPQQKQSLFRAFVAGPRIQRLLKCFVKAEVYKGPNDPRNISTYNDQDKLTMAQFATAMCDHLKQHAWFGPGKTPEQVATRVADICANAKMVNVSDLHRMDGTVTYLLRNVDRAVFLKAFKNQQPALNELLKRNADNVGVLPHGTSFEQGPSHGSGCSATSVSQTLRAAFAAYLGFRNATTPSGDRYTPGEAFAALGIHLGDDGLDADLPIVNHKWAASKVGLVLEAGTVCRGDRGVQFLARFYSPEVWSGRLDSMCDVKRQLSKFHTTLRLPHGVTAEAKLVEKAMGYVAMDANTPVIGPLCKKAVELCDAGRLRTKLGVAPWWSGFDAAVQFPNNNDDGWMDAEFRTQFPEFDHHTFARWLFGVRRLDDLLRAPLCAEPVAAKPGRVALVVDESVLEPAADETPATDVPEPGCPELEAIDAPPSSSSAQDAQVVSAPPTQKAKAAKPKPPQVDKTQEPGWTTVTRKKKAVQANKHATPSKPKTKWVPKVKAG